MDTRLVWDIVCKIRETSPLVHNITNFVVMNNTANGLLALGASPIMAHAGAELEDLLDLASTLVLNIGTLSEEWGATMIRAAKLAARKNLPVVVDPVGAGASAMRTQLALALIEFSGARTVVRGNASEILAVCGRKADTHGVDSRGGEREALQAAESLALTRKCVVVVSGERDIITDGKDTYLVHGGHPMMQRVTGLGCTASAVVGACAGVADSLLAAGVAGMAVMSAAGGLAAAKSAGPGSLQVNFLDALYNLSEGDLSGQMKIEDKYQTSPDFMKDRNQPPNQEREEIL